MPVFTILVVDDESAIRDMLRMALEMADYRVLEAALPFGVDLRTCRGKNQR